MKRLFTLLLTLCSFNNYGQTVVITSFCRPELFQWIENPLSIVVENTSCNNIVVKVSEGRIIQNGCQFTFTIEEDPIDDIKLFIGVKKKGTVNWIEQRTYKIKPAPLPSVRLISTYGDEISKSQLEFGLTLFVPDFTFGLEAVESKMYKVDTFSISVIRNDSTIFTKTNIPGNEVPLEVIEFIRKNGQNEDLLVFSNFRLSLYRKKRLKLPQILTYKLVAER